MSVQNWKKGLLTGHIIIMGNPRQQGASLSKKNDDFLHPNDRYPMMCSEETKEMLEESEVSGVGSYFDKLPNSREASKSCGGHFPSSEPNLSPTAIYLKNSYISEI